MTDNNIVLEAKDITKQFPGVLANDNVNFDLRKGEIHALLGENGAGKTTLMNILYGLYQPDAGEISWSTGNRLVNPLSKGLPSPWGSAWCTSISCSSRSSPSPRISCWATRPCAMGMVLDRKAVAKQVQRALAPIRAGGRSRGAGRCSCRWACSSAWRSSKPCTAMPRS